jgi:hypothetical protein
VTRSVTSVVIAYGNVSSRGGANWANTYFKPLLEIMGDACHWIGWRRHRHDHIRARGSQANGIDGKSDIV